MSGFYATTPARAADEIYVDDFYPSLSPDIFRDHYRVDSSFSDDSVKRALFAALVDVTDDLDDWAEEQQAQGFTTLAEVPAKQLAGQSRLVILFYKAVYCLGKAALIDTYRDVDTARTLGEKRADDHELSSDYWQQKGRYSINKLLGKPTVEAKLI